MSTLLDRYFFFSVIYTSNSDMERRFLWQDLCLTHSCMSEVAWLLTGDFNVILNMSENSDYYLGMTIPMNMQDFRNCVEEVGITDLYSEGPSFTWNNNRRTGFVAKKLDRFLMNDLWLQQFDNVGAAFKPPDLSDHCSGVLSFKHHVKRRLGSFKIFNFFAKHKDFHSKVQIHGP